MSSASSTADEGLSPAARSALARAPAAGWRRLVSESNAWLLTAAVVIGTLTALANIVFRWAIDGAYDFFWGDLGSFLGIGAQPVTADVFRQGGRAIPVRWYLVPLIPCLGMAVLVVLDRWFPGEIKGYGLPRFLEIVNIQGGYIRRRWITLKTLAVAVTLGSGMSAGIEGPIAQIGGSIGSTVSRAFTPSPDRLRVLIACGSAAAIAASFGSPIAGVLFAEEIVLVGQTHLHSLSLLVLAAGTAAAVSQLVSGARGVVTAPPFEYPLDETLFLYVVLGLACGLVAVFFIRSFYRIGDLFRTSRVPPSLQPLAGGLVVGVVLIAFPQVGSAGYHVMNETFRGELGAPLLLTIALLKMLMTGVTLGCGGSGGVFAPSMFVGCVFGGGFAALVNNAFPGAIQEPGSFAVVGMGAFLAAATHAPMTAIFLVFELTRNANVMVPMMIASVLATLVARRVFPDSIDQYDLTRRGLQLSAESETEMLKRLYVRSIMTTDFKTVPASMRLDDFVTYLTNTHYDHFPVVDENDALVGVVSLHDLRAVLLQRESWADRSVVELAHTDVVPLRPSDTLFAAIQEVGSQGLEQVPVVDDADPTKVVGMLERAELQKLYQKRLLARELLG